MMKQLMTVTLMLVLVAGMAHAETDAKRGEKVFEECRACHATELGGEGLGPDLHGMIGRRAGTLESFRYSPAMKKSGITWSAQTLESFISDPQKTVPANRMPYSGMAEAKDRADLILYLQEAFK